jgi:serine/threonine protein kinase/WD40 repeat protein
MSSRPSEPPDAGAPHPRQPRTRARLLEIAAHSPGAGRYVVRGEIARGGMGRILRVWDDDLQRELAMKVIHLGRPITRDEPEGTPEWEALCRFLEEAQITGQLEHPGIVPVHEIGTDAQGQVYYTMPLVRGRDLKSIFELVRRGREGWTQTRALGVLLKVCEAVAYAHERLVLHRDLKPANIMVGRFGETWVMDWGLARALDPLRAVASQAAGEGAHARGAVAHAAGERAAQRGEELRARGALRRAREAAQRAAVRPEAHAPTSCDQAIGTPGYMAPEQALGNAPPSPACDVYSLGAILYHLLTGSMPYELPAPSCAADTIVQRLIEGPPRAVLALEPHAPKDLAAICEKAMARDPAQRYASALELAEELRRHLEGRVVRAYRTGALAKLSKWAQRNRATAAALEGLALLLVLSVLGFGWMRHERGRALAAERGEAERARTAAGRADYASTLLAAADDLRARRSSSAAQRLDACEPQLRAWEWHHLRASCDASRARWSLPLEQPSALSMEPAGRALAAVGPLERACVIELADGALRAHGPRAGAHACIAWAPVGARIASARPDGIAIWSALDGANELELPATHGAPLALAWSSDGALLASYDEAGYLSLHDARRGAARWNPVQPFEARELGALRGLCFGSGDAELVLADARGALARVDARTGALLERRAEDSALVLAWAASPDARHDASALADGGTRIRELESGALLARLEGEARGARALAWLGSSALLAQAEGDRSIAIFDARGARVGSLLGHESGVLGLSASADGSVLASSAAPGELRVWQPRRGSSWQLARADDRWLAVALRARGALAIGARADGHWGSYELASGALRDAGQVVGGLSSAAVDASGERIALGCDDGSVRVHAVRGGALLAHWEGHASAVCALAFDETGEWIASGSADHSLLVRELPGGRLVQRIWGHTGRISGLALEHGSGLLVSSSWDGSARSFALAGGRELARLEFAGVQQTAIALERGGARFAAGGADGRVRIADARTGALEHELPAHEKLVLCLRFSSDGARLASGSLDRRLRVWDARSGSALLELAGNGERVECFDLSEPAGPLVIGTGGPAPGRGENALLVYEGERVR